MQLLKPVVYVLSALIIFVVTACGASVSTSTQNGASASTASGGSSKKNVETKSLVIGSTRDPQNAAEIIVASKQGYFRRQGLKVKTRLFQSGSDLATAIAGKSILIGSAGDSPSTVLRASGNNVQILAQQANISGTQALIVKKGIKNPKDLEGKKVAYSPGNTSEALFLSIVKKYNLNIKRIQTFKMAPTDMLTAFKRGDIDAFVAWDPIVLDAVKNGGVELLSGSQSYIKGDTKPQKLLGAYSVLIGNAKFANKNPNTVTAVLRALEEADKFISSDPKRAAKEVSSTLGVSQSDVENMMSQNQYSLAITPQLVTDLMANAKFLRSKGVIQTIPSFNEYINPTYLKDVDPSLVTWKPSA